MDWSTVDFSGMLDSLTDPVTGLLTTLTPVLVTAFGTLVVIYLVPKIIRKFVR